MNLRRITAMTATAAIVLAACTSGSGTAPSPASPEQSTGTATTDPSAAAATATTAPACERTTVAFRHSWITDELWVPYVAADQLGYYDEVGIDLEQQVGNGGATAVQLVANKEVTFGTAEASHVLTAVSKGIPAVAVGAQLQDLPGAVIVMKDAGIADWNGLRGKKVGGAAASSTSVQFQAVLALQGIPSSEVEFVNLAPPAEQAALLGGQLDGALQFLGNSVGLQKQAGGREVLPLLFRDAGLRAQSTSIVAHPDTIRDNPELVECFLRATMKGLRYVLDHPEEAGAILAKDYPEVDPVVVTGAWALTSQLATSEITDAEGLGWQDVSRWETMQDFMLDGKIIEEAVPDVAAGFTNEFLAKIPKDER